VDNGKITEDLIRATMAVVERDVGLGIISVERTRYAMVDRKKIAKELADKGLSARQIAKVTGASRKTIDRDLGSNDPKNGSNVPPPADQSPWSAHGQPTPDDDEPGLPEKVERSNTMNVFRMNCYASVEIARYDGPVDDTIIKACHDAVQAWTALLTQLKERCHGSKEKEGSR
jgi:Trp operon repressor